MSSSLGPRLRDRLEKSEVIVELQRRGRDPKPGRPDSMIWLRPKNLPVGQLVPLLVELEGAGNYHASKTDVEKFAARHNPQKRPATDTFQYHLDLPTLDWEYVRLLDEARSRKPYTEAPASMTVPVNYEMFTVPSTTVTGERHTTDAKLHRALREVFGEAWRKRETPPGFSSDARIEAIGGTEIVYWDVHWALPNAYKGTVSFPFIVNAGPEIETILRHEIDSISLPMMAVINGSPAAREETLRHETGIRFPGITLSRVSNTRSSIEVIKEWSVQRRGAPQADLERSNLISPAGNHSGGINDG